MAAALLNPGPTCAQVTKMLPSQEENAKPFPCVFITLVIASHFGIEFRQGYKVSTREAVGVRFSFLFFQDLFVHFY